MFSFLRSQTGLADVIVNRNSIQKIIISQNPNSCSVIVHLNDNPMDNIVMAEYKTRNDAEEALNGLLDGNVSQFRGTAYTFENTRSVALVKESEDFEPYDNEEPSDEETLTSPVLNEAYKTPEPEVPDQIEEIDKEEVLKALDQNMSFSEIEEELGKENE